MEELVESAFGRYAINVLRTEHMQFYTSLCLRDQLRKYVSTITTKPFDGYCERLKEKTADMSIGQKNTLESVSQEIAFFEIRERIFNERIRCN